MAPKVTVNFDLPEEQAEYWIHSRASVLFSVLWEIDQHCRSVCKYGHDYKNVEDLADAIRDMIPCLDEE